MRRTTTLVLVWLLIAAASVSNVSAQGVQTGTLRGLVTDQQDLAVPGVSVTVQSDALQGTRTSTTETDGTYLFLTLPPGAYTVNFQIAGFMTVERTTQVPLGSTVELDVTLRPGQDLTGRVDDVAVAVADPFMAQDRHFFADSDVVAANEIDAVLNGPGGMVGADLHVV